MKEWKGEREIEKKRTRESNDPVISHIKFEVRDWLEIYIQNENNRRKKRTAAREKQFITEKMKGYTSIGSLYQALKFVEAEFGYKSISERDQCEWWSTFISWLRSVIDPWRKTFQRWSVGAEVWSWRRNCLCWDLLKVRSDNEKPSPELEKRFHVDVELDNSTDRLTWSVIRQWGIVTKHRLDLDEYLDQVTIPSEMGFWWLIPSIQFHLLSVKLLIFRAKMTNNFSSSIVRSNYWNPFSISSTDEMTP